MLARLGNVIYWASCVAAALCLIPVALVIAAPGSEAAFWSVVYTAAAALIWALGRAVRYVLAGT